MYSPHNGGKPSARGRRRPAACVCAGAQSPSAPVSVAAEQAAAPDGQADGDAGTAVMFAVNLAMLLNRGGTPSLTPAECSADRARPGTRRSGGRPRWPSSCASGPLRLRAGSCLGPTAPAAGRVPAADGDHAQVQALPSSIVSSAANEPLTSPPPLLGLLGLPPKRETRPVPQTRQPIRPGQYRRRRVQGLAGGFSGLTPGAVSWCHRPASARGSRRPGPGA